MCELFGFSGREAAELRPYLHTFFSHSREHPHGWGLARLENGRLLMDKEPVRAVDSLYLKRLLETPLDSPMVIGHIRKATVGTVEWRNCHPYTARDLSGHRWTLAHNGTIFHFPPMDHFYKFSYSDTDSASMLSWFLTGIGDAYRGKGEALTREERFSLLDEMLREITPGNKVNLLIYDDDLYYVHTNMAGTLFRKKTGTGTLFSTTSLEESGWEPVPMNRLLAYDKESLWREGQPHGNTYTENPEQSKLLYLSYAAL